MWTIAKTGGGIACGAGGGVTPSFPAGTYYVWLITSAGYCYVRPAPVVFT